MRGTLVRHFFFLGLDGALDGPQSCPHLSLTGGLRKFLDGLAIVITGCELHPLVDTGRVSLKDLLDQAHPLEEDAPIE